MWEVVLRQGGRKVEVLVDEANEVFEIEREVARTDVPQAVVAAAGEAVPGGRFTSFERIEREGRLEFHVKSTRDGASHKIVLTPDGEVLSVVREQPAEIEIPLPR